MTSKQGNKEYYKGEKQLRTARISHGPVLLTLNTIPRAGTGSMPGLGLKRQGRHGTRSKAPYLLMPERMRTFVVPSNLDKCDVSHRVGV